MIYTHNIQKAIRFSIDVHELNRPERQERKGKKIAYITHPLTVGLILARAGAREEVIIAGILHDTIEDCEPYGSVTKEMLTEKFGVTVAELVDSVSEKNKGLSWLERKELALEEIRQFPHDSLLVKSGDVISNNTELLADFEKDGGGTFERFNSSKEHIINHAIEVINVILEAWPETPLADDLSYCLKGLKKI